MMRKIECLVFGFRINYDIYLACETSESAALDLPIVIASSIGHPSTFRAFRVLEIRNMRFDYPSLRQLLLVHYDNLQTISLDHVNIVYNIDTENIPRPRGSWAEIFDDLARSPLKNGGPNVFRIRQAGYHGYRECEYLPPSNSGNTRENLRGHFGDLPIRVPPSPHAVNWRETSWAMHDKISWHHLCSQIISRRRRRGLETIDYQDLFNFS
jgi:hypothetical protein